MKRYRRKNEDIERTLQCRFCDKKYGSETSLKKHERTKHPSELPPPRAVEQPKSKNRGRPKKESAAEECANKQSDFVRLFLDPAFVQLVFRLGELGQHSDGNRIIRQLEQDMAVSADIAGISLPRLYLDYLFKYVKKEACQPIAQTLRYISECEQEGIEANPARVCEVLGGDRERASRFAEQVLAVIKSTAGALFCAAGEL